MFSVTHLMIRFCLSSSGFLCLFYFREVEKNEGKPSESKKLTSDKKTDSAADKSEKSDKEKATPSGDEKK